MRRLRACDRMSSVPCGRSDFGWPIVNTYCFYIYGTGMQEVNRFGASQSRMVLNWNQR